MNIPTPVVAHPTLADGTGPDDDPDRLIRRRCDGRRNAGFVAARRRLTAAARLVGGRRRKPLLENEHDHIT